MRVTYAEVRETYTPAKRESEWMDLYISRVIRPISFPITWVLVNLGFSANMVTWMATSVLVMALGLIALGDKPLSIIGGVLLSAWLLLDCSDGTIARLAKNKTGTRYGEFLDAVGSYLIYGFLLPVVAWDTVSRVQNARLASEMIVMMGGLSGIFAVLSLTFYHKVELLWGRKTSAEVSPRQHRRWTISTIMYQIGRNFLFCSSFILPLTPIAVALDMVEFYVIIYFFLHAAGVAFVLYKSLREGARLKVDGES